MNRIDNNFLITNRSLIVKELTVMTDKLYIVKLTRLGVMCTPAVRIFIQLSEWETGFDSYMSTAKI